MTLPPRSGLKFGLAWDTLEKTQRLLRERGALGEEGYVVWVGRISNGSASVEDVWPVSAMGDGAHARVAFADVLDLAKRVRERDWYILAQVHSHPGSAFHSAIDDRHAISNQAGFMSVVVPNFGTDAPMQGWQFYEHEGSGQWHLVEVPEVSGRLTSPGHRGLWRRLWNAITAPRSF